MQFSPTPPDASPAKSAEPASSADRVLLGMAASAMSVFALSTMNMFAKLVSSEHSVIEVAFYRNAIAVIPFLIMIFALGQRDMLIVCSKPRALIARSIVGTISLMATFSAFIYLPMADAQALFFTSSLFVPILGYFFLREMVGPYRWSAVLIGFLGMLIMVRPSGQADLAGVALALTAAFLHSILGTLLRLLGKTERPETVAFYFLLIGVCLTGCAMPFVAKVPQTNELLFFVGAGVSGAAGQFFLATAYKYAPAALVTLFNYTGIIWSAAYGWFIWRDWPDTAVWIGALIIIASSIFIVWREQRVARRQALAKARVSELGAGPAP